jgi:hypothetical protein
MRRIALVATGLLALGSSAAAQTPWQGALLLDNDKPAGTDRWYSGGIQASLAGPGLRPPEALARPLEALLPGTPVWGIAVGQLIYTPREIYAATPDPRDRPYAAWLYGAVTLQGFGANDMTGIELQFGMVGPAAQGRAVQSAAHRAAGLPQPRGWSHQIHDEPGLSLSLTRQWRLEVAKPGPDLAIEVLPMLSASLGNVQVQAAAGATLRIGQGLEGEHGPPRLRPGAAGTVFLDPARAATSGWYVFAAVEGRAVAHDITLDGNSWRSSAHVGREPLVGDAAAGLVLLREGVRLTVSATVRSPEVAGQRVAARYGSVSLTTRF